MTSLYVALTMLANNVTDRLKKDDKGATAVEYGLLVGLIAVAIIAALIVLRPQLAGLFDNVSDQLPGAGA